MNENKCLTQPVNDVSCPMPAKRAVSMDILDLIERLTRRAEELSLRTENRLEPVCSSEVPQEDIVQSVEKEYPPLFSSMRKMLLNIDRSLSKMDEILDRLEV